MREVRLDPHWEIPTVEVILGNARKKKARGKLVFDPGSGLTHVDVDLIETLGYSSRDALGIKLVRGAAGDPVEGYIVKLSSIKLFGNEYKDVHILTYDFKDYPGLDGLVGWNLIKQLHLELNGPQETLKIFRSKG